MAKDMYTLINISNKSWVLCTVQSPDFCHVEDVLLVIARDGANYVENLVTHLEQTVAKVERLDAAWHRNTLTSNWFFSYLCGVLTCIHLQ